MQNTQKSTSCINTCETPVIIGAGTGGPQALIEILPYFDASFPGTIIVLQQMGPGMTRVLAKHLSANCQIPVYEPEDGQQLNASEILVVPSNMLFTLANNDESGHSSIQLYNAQNNPELLETRIDTAMASVANLYGRNATGVLLTGMGEDGRDGMRAIADSGGSTIAQNEETSIVFDMPSSAIDAGAVHEVLPLWSIADHIKTIVSRGANANAA